MQRIKKIIILVLFSAISAFSGPNELYRNLFLSQDIQMAKNVQFVRSTSKSPAFNVVRNGQKPKSKGKAFILSLLIPGLGERYAGSRIKSEIFMATEIGLWLGYSGLTTYRDWRKEDYKSFAAAHAYIDLKDKSDSYFVDLGNYDSIYDYNAAKLRQRNLPSYYRDVEAYYWQWDSHENRQKFERLRISADTADNRALFALGMVFANHIISAIDAVWTVHKYNKSQETSINWNIQLGDGGYNSNIKLSLSVRLP